MLEKIEKGWLIGAKQVLSPYCDERPNGELPSLLVIHNISLPPGNFGGPYIDQLFTGKLDPNAHPFFAQIQHLRVSAHLLIRRDGTVCQYVPFHQRAWHAGVSSFEGREKCNDFSIGVELEGTDNDDFSEPQYSRLQQITTLLMHYYPITEQRLTGHSDIAPDRKTDPGPHFDWVRYRDGLRIAGRKG